jgi:hypothetical protein
MDELDVIAEFPYGKYLVIAPLFFMVAFVLKWQPFITSASNIFPTYKLFNSSPVTMQLIKISRVFDALSTAPPIISQLLIFILLPVPYISILDLIMEFIIFTSLDPPDRLKSP